MDEARLWKRHDAPLSKKYGPGDGSLRGCLDKWTLDEEDMKVCGGLILPGNACVPPTFFVDHFKHALER